MKLATEVIAPPHLTNPVPSALTWQQTMLAVMYPIGRQALDSIRGGNPKTAGSFWLQPVDEGRAVGFGIGSSWPKWWVLEYDMPAHQIDAGKNAPFLRFIGRDGNLVKVRSVDHPGHAGNMAIQDAIGVAEAQLRAALPNAVRVIWTGGQV
jgi:hypothetical protein